jgi:hypothetical protein
VCATVEPELTEIASGHRAACLMVVPGAWHPLAGTVR